ncbi:hypothetical protein CEUSTIGMA_g2395.t1 [Chlamydomonas eustigma]|uniref:Uncharacterized protein n=1 Tax=Chlamydomonas eustigma TaxID=1157962 RepID=A0A250WW64_9CHLO|nr:hypothetical protein CEUSTIGMA_g2395.t1 [Chlamydomonas eustigma]|eukprot:GAX74949.1 hypothetical protein CEUSTIGMA_g2395.t1 [Chlamydomonas eustigma]
MDATSCRIYCIKQHRPSLRARAKKAGHQSCRQNFRFQWRSGRKQENDVQDFRVLELFSGIGGMHYAVKRILPTCYVEAVDINTVANKVYEHNFGERPHTLDLNQITWDTLDSYGADMWCLSPPCQPYTRTVFGKRLDASDNRSRSLIHLLEQLPLMQRPPKYLIMENVEGFVGGKVHGLLKEALLACSYQLQV